MTYAKNSTITAIHRPITNGMYNDTYTVIYSNGIRRNYTIKGAMNKKHFEFIQSATVESRYSKHTGKHTADIFTAPAEPKEEPTAEDQATEEPKEDKHMKKRFFYLADIDSTMTVEQTTKKELLSIADGLKNSTFCEHSDTISGYTKDGKFFYYDCTNFWDFKKSDIIDAVSVVYSHENGNDVWGAYIVNEYGVVNPTDDGQTLIWNDDNIKEVESADYREASEDQAAEEAEAVKEEETARAEEATNADDYVTPFETVKAHLFAKVEHIGEDFPTGSEWFGKRYGEDIAVTVWIDNGTAKPERLDRGTVHKWIDRHDVTILNRVFNTALENTMANEKPRLYKNIFTTDCAQIEETALLESFYIIKSLPDDKNPMITTSKQTGGAIACFYPPVCAKISELFGGTGFYVSFTSPNEGIIHAPGSIDISSMRRNLRETNNIFGMSGALTNDVFYYDPVMMRLDAVTE